MRSVEEIAEEITVIGISDGWATDRRDKITTVLESFRREVEADAIERCAEEVDKCGGHISASVIRALLPAEIAPGTKGGV